MPHLPTPSKATHHLARHVAHHAAQHPGLGAMRTAVIGSLLALSAVALSLGASSVAFAADKASDTASSNATPAAPAAPAPGAMPPRMAHGMGHGMAHGAPGERGAWAGHGEHAGMGMMMGGRHFERVLTEVKATDAQRAQIKQITEKARADVQALHAQGKGLHERAMALWTAPKLDAAEADKVRQQMLAQHDQVSKRMMQAMLDVGNVLTPEQRAKAAELVKAQRARRADRMADHPPMNR